MAADSQQEVIAFLSQPEAYGVASVQRVETHASIVFLAGGRAYKLKKAVRFSYLDYSTPQLRHAACQKELALNRRTAPDLYLRVLPVRRAASGGLTLGGDGAIVDWLLVMLRFDASGQFDRMARHGQLTTEMMRQPTGLPDSTNCCRRSSSMAGLRRSPRSSSKMTAIWPASGPGCSTGRRSAG
jgi:aminoglycoside phosphotransferase family enzyme